MIIEAADAPLTAERTRVDLDRKRLVGSRCPECGIAAWPARAVCHNCGQAPVEIVALEPTGTLLTYTTVWVPRPGLEPPFILGQVKIDDGPTIFCHVGSIDDSITVPHPVKLMLAEKLASIPPFWFEPEVQSEAATQ